MRSFEFSRNRALGLTFKSGKVPRARMLHCGVRSSLDLGALGTVLCSFCRKNSHKGMSVMIYHLMIINQRIWLFVVMILPIYVLRDASIRHGGSARREFAACLRAHFARSLRPFAN
jgi:hypothetical protein